MLLPCLWFQFAVSERRRSFVPVVLFFSALFLFIYLFFHRLAPTPLCNLLRSWQPYVIVPSFLVFVSNEIPPPPTRLVFLEVFHFNTYGVFFYYFLFSIGPRVRQATSHGIGLFIAKTLQLFSSAFLHKAFLSSLSRSDVFVHTSLDKRRERSYSLFLPLTFTSCFYNLFQGVLFTQWNRLCLEGVGQWRAAECNLLRVASGVVRFRCMCRHLPLSSLSPLIAFPPFALAIVYVHSNLGENTYCHFSFRSVHPSPLRRPGCLRRESKSVSFIQTPSCLIPLFKSPL